MKARHAKSRKKKDGNSAPTEVKLVESAQVAVAKDEVPTPEAFIEEAKKETKRKLISDHSETITVLRNEKRFTFRQIADWLTDRGIEADHSSVYRAYLAAVPEENRDPRESWEEVDTPE